MTASHNSPDDGSRSVRAAGDEIDAEIADHLATAAERLQAQGASSAEAQTQAEQAFGDPTAVRRSCYWIQHGDTLMFRGAVIALLSLLCLGLTITAIASWRSQARMAQQMTALTEQLKALAEKPAAAPATAATTTKEVKPLGFEGRAFVSAVDRPAADKSLEIIAVGDGKTVRRVSTDSAGRFQSGPLPEGDYAIVAALDDELRQSGNVQFAPILVYPGAAVPPLAIDVGYPSGRIKLELSRPLAHNTRDGKYTIESRLLVHVATDRWQASRWTTARPGPNSWPIFIRRGYDHLIDQRSGGLWFYELLSNADLEAGWAATRFGAAAGQLPAGECKVTAVILTDLIPVGYERPDLQLSLGPFGGRRGGSPQAPVDIRWRSLRNTNQIESGHGPDSLSEEPLSLADDNLFWMTKGLGTLWRERLVAAESGQPYPSLQRPNPIPLYWLRSSDPTIVPIQAGLLTRLRIDVPEDLESKVVALVEANPKADDFSKFTMPFESSIEMVDQFVRNGSPLMRSVAIAVLGTEPLNEPAGETAAGSAP